MKNLRLYLVMVILFTVMCILLNGPLNSEYVLGGLLGFGCFWALMLWPMLNEES